MTTTEPSYAATGQHIRFLAEKRARLAQAQAEAEEQFVAAVAREVRAGRLTAAELEAVYLDIRDATLEGFATKRWQPALPSFQQIRAKRIRDEYWGQPRLDSWIGPFPVKDNQNTPRLWDCVVYVLYDQAGVPCYVGSTERFWDRMTTHAREGKPAARWQAHRCRDREHAYEVETQFLQQHKPYLNKKASR